MNKIFTNNYNRLLIFIFLIILVFRFYFAATHVRFGQDQARDTIYMEQFADENKIFIGYGPKTSVSDFRVPPFYYQLYYWLSLLTNNHPLTMLWVTTAIEALTPLIFLLWLGYLFKDSIALPVSVLFGFFFMPVTYGTAAWNPNMIPFFSTLALYFWFVSYYDNKKWAIVLGALCVAIAIHLNYQSIVLLPFSAIIALLSIKKDKNLLPTWILAIFFFVLPFLPYFYAEIQNGWQNTNQIYKYFSQIHSSFYDRVSIPSFFLTFIPSFIERAIAQYNFRFIFLGRLIFCLGLTLMLASGLKDKKMRIALLYFASIFVMMRVYKGDKNDYYMSTLYIMPAFFLALIYKRINKIALIIIIFIAIQSGIHLGAANRFNELKTLYQSMDYIKKTIKTNSAHFIFRDKNMTNIFIYGLQQYEIRNDIRSNYIVDICNTTQSCNNVILNRCNGDTMLTYSSLIKNSGKFKPISKKIINSSHLIIIGKNLQKNNYLPKSTYHFDIN